MWNIMFYSRMPGIRDEVLEASRRKCCDLYIHCSRSRVAIHCYMVIPVTKLLSRICAKTSGFVWYSVYVEDGQHESPRRRIYSTISLRIAIIHMKIDKSSVAN